MPSDCQCSTACNTTVVKTEVLNNKKATQRLKRLELEVVKLKDANSRLKTRLRKADVSKKKIVDDLRARLNKI